MVMATVRKGKPELRKKGKPPIIEKCVRTFIGTDPLPREFRVYERRLGFESRGLVLRREGGLSPRSSLIGFAIDRRRIPYTPRPIFHWGGIRLRRI